MLTDWLDSLIHAITTLAPDGTFFSLELNIRGLIAIVLVALSCGAVGSLIVGNRMAFFSDALAHCTFAGVALGLLLGVNLGAEKDGPYYQWGLPAIMVLFGVLVGLCIAFVRENSSLANDTVIGVFFAGALGLGAVLLSHLSQRAYLSPETFLFGSYVSVQSSDLLILGALVLVTAVVFGFLYNGMVLVAFNPSLARSRRVPVRLCNYLLIILLALIVNLCLKIVGALLINGLLLVPVATACTLTRNMRQLFWVSALLCVGAGVAGQLLQWELAERTGASAGVGGTIIVLSVVLFFLSMLGLAVRNWREHREAACKTSDSF